MSWITNSLSFELFLYYYFYGFLCCSISEAHVLDRDIYFSVEIERSMATND